MCFKIKLEPFLFLWRTEKTTKSISVISSIKYYTQKFFTFGVKIVCQGTRVAAKASQGSIKVKTSRNNVTE